MNRQNDVMHQAGSAAFPVEAEQLFNTKLALKVGLPYLFRHQIIAYLTCEGLISPKLKCVVKLEKRKSRELQHGFMAVSEHLPCRNFKLR